VIGARSTTRTGTTGSRTGGRGARLGLGALALAVTALTAGCGGGGHATAAGTQAVTQAAAAPSDSAASDGTQPTAAARGGAAVPRLTVPLHTGTVAPHLPPPAGPGGKVIPNRSGPSKVPVPANVDGCDHDYGNTGQCVPWKIEGSTTAARCDWLTAHGFGPLKVHAKDRQHLDTDGNGTACDSGDRS
jgi:hypothetical protein